VRVALPRKVRRPWTAGTVVVVEVVEVLVGGSVVKPGESDCRTVVAGRASRLAARFEHAAVWTRAHATRSLTTLPLGPTVTAAKCNADELPPVLLEMRG
jgi:hypothetical protein